MSEKKMKDQSPVTVEELDKLLEQLATKEKEAEAIEKSLTEKNKEIMQLEGRCVNYLKDLGRDSYVSPHGKFSIEEKWRVNLPVDDQAKREFFNHLRERGIFDKYATVPSNSLNALYMADWAEAKERGEGMTFSMPGIGSPQLFEKPKFKAVKK